MFYKTRTLESNESRTEDLIELRKSKFNWDSIVYKFNYFIVKGHEQYYNKKLDIDLFVKRKRGFFVVKNGMVIFDTVITPNNWDDVYERLRDKNILLEYIIKDGFDDDV